MVSAGFGYPTPPSGGVIQRWKPLFSVAEIGGSSSAATAAENRDNATELRRQRTLDVEDQKGNVHELAGSTSSSELGKELGSSKVYGKKLAVVQGLNRPLFHIDLNIALQSAIANIERDEGIEQKAYGVKQLWIFFVVQYFNLSVGAVREGRLVHSVVAGLKILVITWYQRNSFILVVIQQLYIYIPDCVCMCKQSSTVTQLCEQINQKDLTSSPFCLFYYVISSPFL